jgi:hypothetical protein
LQCGQCANHDYTGDKAAPKAYNLNRILFFDFPCLPLNPSCLRMPIAVADASLFNLETSVSAG